MIRVTDRQFWMQPYLKARLDTIIHNVKNDYQTIIVVSGSAKTRVGKSMVAQQCAYYISYHLKREFNLNNCVFSGDELIKAGKSMPPSVFIYDEARAELNNKMGMSRIQNTLIDFFAETGMLNHVIFLVLTDFFELSRNLAVGQSRYLINCFEKDVVVHDKDLQADVVEWVRGYYGFYGENRKRWLYLKGKKDYDNYDAHGWDFWGEFRKHWVLDQAAYNKKKMEFINRERNKLSPREILQGKQRNILIWWMLEKKMATQSEIAKLLGLYKAPVTQRGVGKTLRTKNYGHKIPEGDKTFSGDNNETFSLLNINNEQHMEDGRDGRNNRDLAEESEEV